MIYASPYEVIDILMIINTTVPNPNSDANTPDLIEIRVWCKNKHIVISKLNQIKTEKN